jgi:hypothetical protein
MSLVYLEILYLFKLNFVRVMALYHSNDFNQCTDSLCIATIVLMVSLMNLRNCIRDGKNGPGQRWNRYRLPAGPVRYRSSKIRTGSISGPGTKMFLTGTITNFFLNGTGP